MSLTYVFSQGKAEVVLGPNDKNAAYLELLLGGEIYLKGNSILFGGSNDFFIPLMEKLEELSLKEEVIGESEIFMEFQSITNSNNIDNKNESIVVLGKSVWPKSNTQKDLIRAMRKSQIVFASGPAGTGKTFLAICYALEEVLSGKKNKIVLTRPVVEAGESLGFLPGDLSQKLNPYLRPLYDAMDLILKPSQIKRLEENGTIEIAPLAYMRGRSLNNSIVILDEAQNTTRGQMRMFLTRLGESSKAIVTGDPTQIDLPHKSDSGFIEAMRILTGISGLTVVRFSHRDTVRSRIVSDITSRYDKEEENEEY